MSLFILDYIKMDRNTFCNAKFRGDSRKIINSSSKKDKHIFFFFANVFPISFGSYIFDTWQKYSLVFIGYREKSWNM